MDIPKTTSDVSITHYIRENSKFTFLRGTTFYEVLKMQRCASKLIQQLRKSEGVSVCSRQNVVVILLEVGKEYHI